jgi:transcriptional/translational regulatory protein YebC/TACO1
MNAIEEFYVKKAKMTEEEIQKMYDDLGDDDSIMVVVPNGEEDD